MPATVDARELESKVKDMYRAVADHPEGRYHFELGRSLAERLGYPGDVLDEIPEGAVESFAGVGYFFDLAELREGESVIDLGSGSGMDVFFAAHQVGRGGHVAGVDFSTSPGSTSPRSSSKRHVAWPSRVDGTRSSSARAGSSASPLTTRASTARSRTA